MLFCTGYCFGAGETAVKLTSKISLLMELKF